MFLAKYIQPSWAAISRKNYIGQKVSILTENFEDVFRISFLLYLINIYEP